MSFKDMVAADLHNVFLNLGSLPNGAPWNMTGNAMRIFPLFSPASRKKTGASW